MEMTIQEQNNMDYNNLTLNEIHTLIRENKMNLLGYANGWSTTPPEVINANKNKYKYYSERGSYNCETIYYCPEGGFYYYVDSSD
jgi:hypothetical protein